MRGYVWSPERHPVKVAELNDANRLRGLAGALELNIDDLSSATARKATFTAIQALNGAARQLNP